MAWTTCKTDRVPHLRDGLIVAKVGSCANAHPLTDNSKLRRRAPLDLLDRIKFGNLSIQISQDSLCALFDP
jgi:hypothetical protein